MVTVYVLRGDSGRRYVGITNNLPRRLNEHRSAGTSVSRMLGDFRLIFTEEYTDHAQARIREKFLKSGQGRKWLDEWENQARPASGG
ncbi:MAG TPA: GIY-YIG nuclease family protein [candidate division Zixibacteria bacterium]